MVINIVGLQLKHNLKLRMKSTATRNILWDLSPRITLSSTKGFREGLKQPLIMYVTFHFQTSFIFKCSKGITGQKL